MTVALQIAAASPVAAEYVTRDEVKADHLEHEKEILIAQARNEGKPEKIIEKMVMGRINKFYQEVCLMEQPFVKDPDMNVREDDCRQGARRQDHRASPVTRWATALRRRSTTWPPKLPSRLASNF